MTYQRQTKDVWFKGRQAYDPSKLLTKENKDLETQQLRHAKDLEAAGRDYSNALKVWKDVSKIPDQEQLEAISTLTKAGSDFFGKTSVSILKYRKAKNIEKADLDYEKASLEEKRLIQEYWGKKLKNEIIADNEIDELANQATQQGFKSYAALLRNKNKHYNTQLLILAGQERLKGLDIRLANILTNDSWFDENGLLLDPADPDFESKKAFNGSEALEDHAKRQLVYNYLKTEFYTSVSKDNNLNANLLVATLKDSFEEIIDARESKIAEQQNRNSMANRLSEQESGIKQAIALAKLDTDGEIVSTLALKQQVESYINSAPTLNFFLNTSQPDSASRIKLNTIFEEFIANSSDRDEAYRIVNKIISDVKIQKPGGKPGELVAIGTQFTEFDSVNYRSIAAGTHDQYQIQSTTIAEGLINDIKNSGYGDSTIFDKIKKDGYESLSKEEQVAFEKTIMGKWLLQVRQTGQPIDEDTLQAQALKILNETGNDNLARMVMDFNYDIGGVLNAAETKAALEELAKTTPGGIILNNHSVFLTGDQETIDEFKAKFKDKILISDTQMGGEDGVVLKDTYAELTKLVTRGGELTPASLNVLNKLEEVFHDEYRDAKRNNDLLPENDPRKLSEAKLIQNAYKAAEELYNVGSQKQGDIFYYDVEKGQYTESRKELKAFIGNKNEYYELENEITIRNISSKLNNYESKAGETFSSSQKLIPVDWIYSNNSGLKQRFGGADTTSPIGNQLINQRLPQRIIDAALAAGENPYVFYNNQVEAHGLPDSEKLVIPPIVSSFLNTNRSSDINNIIKVLTDIDGDDMGVSNSIEASREINKIIDKTFSSTPRLQENNLLKTIASTTNGNYEAINASLEGPRSDGVDQNPFLGNYGIPKNVVIEICQELDIPYPGDTSFLKNKPLQDKIAKHRITAILDNIPNDISKSEQLRLFYSLWSTGKPDDIKGDWKLGFKKKAWPITLEGDTTTSVFQDQRLNQGTFFLNTYNDIFK